MTRILQWYRFARLMGLRYTSFRSFYELKRRSGLLKREYPTDPAFTKWISLTQWRKEAPVFFFHSRRDFDFRGSASAPLMEKASRILKGEIQFFQGEWKSIESDDWLTNLATGHRYDNQKHWTEIPDFDPVYGDIKYVWERSRFSFLQTVLRYDAHRGTDSSEWVFRQMESWIQHNPINQGPNYRCSQETSLRVFNWTLALYFYRDAEGLTEERFAKILFSIYWQLRHVRRNINFSRVAVRNNHAITETLALYTAGLLFPFFEEASEWKTSGKKWFEEEVAYQVYEDGTYLQFSFNYHRVVIQLLTWAVGLAHRHQEVFGDLIYQRAFAALKVLMHSQDVASGCLPNYGSNDGSLFFQWNDAPFRDFRPSLDALYFALTGEDAYSEKFEDRAWFSLKGDFKRFEPFTVRDGIFSYPKGGIFIFRQKGFMVWINCVNYKDRPHQADALHVDVWHKGENLLCDAGSYLYNTSADKVKYFSGTESHNTVALDDQDQMMKGPRFVWINWTSSDFTQWTSKESLVVFEGRAKVFEHLGDITHHRKVSIDADRLQIIVSDRLIGAKGKTIRQLWHLNPARRDKISFDSTAGGEKGTPKETLKFTSPTYGILVEALQVEFQTTNETITTQITFA